MILNYSGGKHGIKPPDFLWIWGLHSVLLCGVLETLAAGVLEGVEVVIALLAGFAAVGSTGAVATVLAGFGASTPAAT